MANSKKKSKYTAAQKKAYYSGMGYRVGRAGKEVPFKNPENRVSFQAGYAAGKKPAAKYPDLKK